MNGKKMRPKVIMIGPSVNGKGGMSEAVRNLLRSDLVQEYEILYLATIVSGFMLKKFLILLWQIPRLFYLGFVFHPQLVHIHFCSGTSFFRKSIFIQITKLLKIPVLLHAHGGRFSSFYENSLPPVRLYIRKILAASDLIILVSPKKLPWMKKLLTTSSIEIVPNIISLPSWVAQRDYSNNKSCKTIVFLGVIKKSKGVFDLIEAASFLTLKDQNIKFTICGTGQIKEAKKLCGLKKVTRFVEFTGWIDENRKFQILHQADILVLPSHYEELPYAILEGMAAGLPIVTTNVSGAALLIQNELNGMLFTPGNVSQLVTALSYLLDNPEIRDQMGKNNLELIKNKFNPEKITKQILNIYQKFLRS